MWIFTETGFISAVRTAPGSADLKVRSRDRLSLEPLASMTGAEIVKSPHGDYPYRVFITAEQLGLFLAWSVDGLEYDNFKSQVYATRGYDFAHALSGVWSIMHDVEDADARSTTRSSG